MNNSDKDFDEMTVENIILDSGAGEHNSENFPIKFI